MAATAYVRQRTQIDLEKIALRARRLGQGAASVHLNYSLTDGREQN